MRCLSNFALTIHILAGIDVVASIALRTSGSSPRQLNQSLNSSFVRSVPAPRIPPECTECEKLRGDQLSCSGMKAVCECCKDIFKKKTKKMCQHFEKNLGKSYRDRDGKNCPDTIRVAMEQRNSTCASPYDRSEPLRGLAPKRFNDMCNGTQPVGCGGDMCSRYGCNGELRRVEEEYRVIEQYKQTFDEHPCAYQDDQNAARVRAEGKTKDKVDFDKASAEKKAADKAAEEAAADEAAAAEKVAVSRAKLDQAEASHKEAKRINAEKAAAEKEAAKRAAAARVALEYATSDKAVATEQVRKASIAKEEAARELAEAQGAHEKAKKDRAAADSAAAKKAAAKKGAAQEAGVEYDEETEKKRIDEGMAEDAFRWSMNHRRRRSSL